MSITPISYSPEAVGSDLNHLNAFTPWRIEGDKKINILTFDIVNILKFANAKFESATNFVRTIALRYIENCEGKEDIDLYLAKFREELIFCLSTFELIDALCVLFAKFNSQVSLDGSTINPAKEISLNDYNARYFFEFSVSIRNNFGSYRYCLKPGTEGRAYDLYFIEYKNLSIFLNIELVDIIDKGENELLLIFNIKYSAIIDKDTKNESEVLYFEKLTSLRVETFVSAENDRGYSLQSKYRCISGNPYYKFFGDFVIDIVKYHIKKIIKIKK
jgi:hypothetical protein